MSDFTQLLPLNLPRAQKVTHEHVLEALRALITDMGTTKSLIKRVSLKLEVLTAALSTADQTALETIVSDINAQVLNFQTWVENYEATYEGTVV